MSQPQTVAELHGALVSWRNVMVEILKEALQDKEEGDLIREIRILTTEKCSN